jgi:glycosyltransferase involved in cell wall biosynthesis
MITTKMNQPLLHVIIPAFGKSQYLRETLESATKYLPIFVPITVIEDPSSDMDLEGLVKQFPRVKYFRNDKKLGIGGNFNKAIEISSGEFTQICGSDDIFLQNFFQTIYNNRLSLPGVSAVGFDVEVINEITQRVKTVPDFAKNIFKPKHNHITIFKNKKLFSSLMLGDWLYFPAIIWRTSVIRKLEFNSSFHTAMDLDILIRLLEDDKQIAFINEKVLGYRRHDQSASSLYAKSIGRFEEEFKCHKNAIEVARNKNWKTGVFLAQLALTVRLHAIMQSFLMVFSSPRSALKVLVKAISPIR